MDDPIAWMPDAPDPQVTVTVHTAQGVSPGALLIALAVGHWGDDFDRALDDPFDLGQSLLNPMLDRGKRLGGLHPVIADPLKAFGKHMLNHAPDKRVDLHRLSLDPLAFVGPIMIGDPLSIVAINTPERNGRTHHVFSQIRGQALIPGRHIALLHVGHKPVAISPVTRIDYPLYLLRLHGLPQHRQQIPLPLLAERGIRDVVQMHPLSRLPIPAATGGDDVQMGVVLAIAAMGLDDDDVPACEILATDPAKDIIQTPDPTAHERAQ
jgi:hypothetical protein